MAAAPTQPPAGPGRRARLARCWPELRALLIGLHLLAVVLLSLPAPDRLGDRASWKAPGAQQEFRSWAERLARLGWHTTPEAFEAALWRLTRGYLAWRERATAGFATYADLVGAQQGWRMFSNPQTRPARLEVALAEAGPGGCARPLAFRPIYVARSERHRWRHIQLDHNRVRKLTGRVGRSERRAAYEELVAWLGRQAARDFPRGCALRVRRLVFTSLPPAQVRAGETPAVEVADERLVDLRRLRGGAAAGRER